MAGYPKNTFQFDRRSGKDRRSHKMPEIKSLFKYGRRKGIRRQVDKYKIFYFDQYSSALFVSIVIILFLNIMIGPKKINKVLEIFADNSWRN